MRRSVLALVTIATLTGVTGAQPAATAPKTAPPTTKQPAQPAAPAAPKYGQPTPKPRTPGAIRIATYNVENLFDDKDDPALSGQYEDKDMTKQDPECRALAAAIKAVDADVLALEEIESYEALIWFRDTYLKDLGYTYAVSKDAGDERGIEQSVLSRFPISDSKNWVKLPLGGTHPDKWGNKENDHAGQPILYHRSPLMVTIDVPESAKVGDPVGDKPYKLTLFVVHQKSGKDGGYWREKEAAKTVQLIGDLQKDDPNRSVVLLGDFNSVLTDASMKIITDTGMFDVLAPVAKEPAAEGASKDKQPRQDKVTITHASGRSYDHILLNPAARAGYVAGSVFVLGTPPKNSLGYASDHNPVVIDLIPKIK